jgi:hypothetical protein
MKKSYVVLSVIAVVIAALVIFWNVNRISGTWRYKMTVTVETPEGIKTGYAVREVGNSASRIKIGGTPESTPRIFYKGEAVVVDLGDRGTLFAISSGYKMGVDHSMRIFYRAFDGKTTFEGIRRLNRLPIGTKVTLDPIDYPVLVTFKDMNDPKSVIPIVESQSGRIDSRALNRGMEDKFGKDVRLKAVTLEITDEPVTWGIVDQYLPWLKKLAERRARLNGNIGIAISTNNLADNLGPWSFSYGENR